MRLLISVANAQEAAAALAGGADFIDAKDPFAGALGAVTPAIVREIHAVVSGARPVTAALGEACDETSLERAATAYAAAGAALVKVGFGGVADERCVARLIAAAVRGASVHGSGVIAVAYADSGSAGSVRPARLVNVAARAGAAGLLIDTHDKYGGGLRRLIGSSALAALVERAHGAGLMVALAGKLTLEDLPYVRDAGADIAGVRGAACDGGRTGTINVERVAALCALTRQPYPPHAAEVDIVVKLGGGILAHTDAFAGALRAIGEAAAVRRILIVPGGGPFADAVRDVARRVVISDDAAHWMAILGMDQYAHLIAARLPAATVVDDRSQIAGAFAAGRVPVLAPYRWMRAVDPLPHSWNVTSDSIAAWMCGVVGARHLVVVKPPGVLAGRSCGDLADSSDPSFRDLVDAHFDCALPGHIGATIVAADHLDRLDAALRGSAADRGGSSSRLQHADAARENAAPHPLDA
jgi:uncharacterized protein (UPF0264 family)/aspartokinase-like uncharacterized kinase